MGLLQSFFKKNEREEIIDTTDKKTVYAPAEGDIIPLEEIEDAMFAQGLLGKGCGINPTVGKILAPFEGEVVVLSSTKHALGLKSVDGIELLIHIGIDTVKMNGQGFNALVKVGDSFKCGQNLMTFSIPEIKKSGYSTTIAVVVTNTDAYEKIELVKQGTSKRLEKMLKVY